MGKGRGSRATASKASTQRVSKFTQETCQQINELTLISILKQPTIRNASSKRVSFSEHTKNYPCYNIEYPPNYFQTKNEHNSAKTDNNKNDPTYTPRGTLRISAEDAKLIWENGWTLDSFKKQKGAWFLNTKTMQKIFIAASAFTTALVAGLYYLRGAGGTIKQKSNKKNKKGTRRNKGLVLDK